ncbi:MAG: ankyrin repeat domain-containing protein [Treponemataceae bacterium]|nr:ankyrin repeat domain-containing protein [Treponemataceae bacterium]
MKKCIFLLIVLLSLRAYAKRTKNPDPTIAVPPVSTYTPGTKSTASSEKEPQQKAENTPKKNESDLELIDWVLYGDEKKRRPKKQPTPPAKEPTKPAEEPPPVAPETNSGLETDPDFDFEFEPGFYLYFDPDDQFGIEPETGFYSGADIDFAAESDSGLEPDTAEDALPEVESEPEPEPEIAADLEPEIPEPPAVPPEMPSEPPEPYQSVYLLDYLELDREAQHVPESAFDPNAGRYQFIENADAKDAEGRTLLMKAARDANIGMIENLLYSEANVNAADNDGWTALMFAARFSDSPRTVELLLNAGAQAQAENNYGITALLLATGFSRNTQVVSRLLEKRSVAEKEVLAAFIYGITNEVSPAILQLFIDKGIAINAPYEGKTALMYAAETNTSTATIQWLLAHGARAHYKTTAGQTAFDFARANRRLPKDAVYWSLNASGAHR